MLLHRQNKGKRRTPIELPDGARGWYAEDECQLVMLLNILEELCSSTSAMMTVESGLSVMLKLVEIA